MYDSSLYMANLDAESLSTNIPLNETTNYCVSDLYSKNICNGKHSKRDLFKLLDTATSESSFTFDYLLYKQVIKQVYILWTPPLQMHFYAITKKWLHNCPIHFKSMIYKSYVDNIFVIFSSKEDLQLFEDSMSKQHKCLKFIHEAVNNNSFSFLDIRITRHNQQLKTSVYRKPTFSGVLTYYESYLDQTYKKSLIDTLLFRCF